MLYLLPHLALGKDTEVQKEWIGSSLPRGTCSRSSLKSRALSPGGQKKSVYKKAMRVGTDQYERFSTEQQGRAFNRRASWAQYSPTVYPWVSAGGVYNGTSSHCCSWMHWLCDGKGVPQRDTAIKQRMTHWGPHHSVGTKFYSPRKRSFQETHERVL
jgi:hypothetical protein